MTKKQKQKKQQKVKGVSDEKQKTVREYSLRI